MSQHRIAILSVSVSLLLSVAGGSAFCAVKVFKAMTGSGMNGELRSFDTYYDMVEYGLSDQPDLSLDSVASAWYSANAASMK